MSTEDPHWLPSDHDTVSVTITVDDAHFREAVARVQWTSEGLVALRDEIRRGARLAPDSNSAPLPGPLCSWFMHADGTVARRLPGESRIDATERVLSSYSYGADTQAFDLHPENCWRCDSKGAETDVGLCTACHEDLRTP
jgi:hypothetical protein